MAPTPFNVRDQDDPGRDLGEWTDDGSIRLPGNLTVGGSVIVAGGATVGGAAVAAGIVGNSGQLLTAGETSMPREVVTAGSQPLVSGSLVLTYFTSLRTETITRLGLTTNATAAGATPTLARMGVYAMAASGDLTLVAATANDTTLFPVAFTRYERMLTGGWGKVAGQRYAVGVLVVSVAALPSFFGMTGGTASAFDVIYGRDPRLSGIVAGLADLPATQANAGITPTRKAPIYYEMLP